MENPWFIKMFDRISNYNVDVKHIVGKDNIPADIMSRLPDKSRDFPEIASHVPLRSIEAVQTRSSSVRLARDLISMAGRARDDPEYQKLISSISKGVDLETVSDQCLQEYKEAWKDLKLVSTEAGDLVYLNNLLLPPKGERQKLIESCHQAHMSLSTTVNNQRKIWWWPSMKKDIEEQWKNCPQCMKCKMSKTRSPPVTPVDLMTFTVGEMLSMDLFELNKRHYLMGVDKVSQFMLCRQIPNQKTSTISKVLEEWSLTLGLSTVIKSDGGPCFKSALFSKFCQEFGITHILTSPYNPSSNGQAE